jgi:hypothetical protein
LVKRDEINLLTIQEKTYRLTEIEAESLDYEEAIEFCRQLRKKGFIPDLVTGFKKNDEKTTVHFIKAFKKVLF